MEKLIIAQLEGVKPIIKQVQEAGNIANAQRALVQKHHCLVDVQRNNVVLEVTSATEST